MFRTAIKVLSAVATGAAVVEGASLVFRGAKVAAKATQDRLAGTEFTMSATAQNEANRKKALSGKKRKETRQVAKDSRKRAKATEKRLKSGAKMASASRGPDGQPIPAGRPVSRQAARQAQMSRRMRELSSALEKKSDEALSRDQDLADALMKQAASVAQLAENPPASAAGIPDPIVAQLVDALSRSGGSDVQRMASELADRRVPSPDEYGAEEDEEVVFDVVMGWPDEDEDALGSHCSCGSGGVCGCSMAGHDKPSVSISPHAASSDALAGPDEWDGLPDFVLPFGLRRSESIGRYAGRAPRLSSGGCKTGMCPMPK
jgi:hypothetical protein